MGEMEEKKYRSLATKLLIAALLLAVVAGIAWLLTSQTETRVSRKVGENEYGSLECTIGSMNEELAPVIEPKDLGESMKYSIRMLFENGELSSISYTFDGVYAAETVAENVRASLHADYNKYMGNNGVSAESLNPVFMHDGHDVKISFYAERKKLSSAVAPVFLISRDEYGRMNDFSLDNMQKLYEGKGFTCNAQE